MGYCSLHNHTQFSLLDGLSKPEDLAKRCAALGMTACAITDHGNGAGLPEFYEACKKNGIKPILGCEFYEAPESRFDQKKIDGDAYYHLILLVKNEQGYKNLCKLITRSNTEGYYYKPRIDYELLSQFHEGLVCLSACVAGRIPSLLVKDKIGEAEEWVKKYKALFGEDFYIEVQNHGIEAEIKSARGLFKLARTYNLKTVATNDTHYIYKEDSVSHAWQLCLQTGKQISDPDRLIYTGDYSLKSEDEMKALFPQHPESILNTMEVADKCNFEFKSTGYRMPKVTIPDKYGTDYFGYLQDLAWTGYEERYPDGHPYRTEAKTRLQYELDVIKEMGFAEYFLDTRKTINWCHEHNILTGVGRGSAAGSCMCYCLHITELEPLKYGLLFERFLNKERVSMPDIDTDYDPAYHEEIIEAEALSNGKDKFAKIQTFTTSQAKAIVRDCTRVAGLAVFTGETLAKYVNGFDNLQAAWDGNPDLQAYVNSDQDIKQVWEMACKLEGIKKASSTHACGVIPTPVPCEDLFPCSVEKGTGYLICQYDMVFAEKFGNLKKDILMLKNLTVINNCNELIKERTGKVPPLWAEEILNDKKALQLIASGDTNGVFQLESAGMKEVVKKLQPDTFEDIIALVALYRPGPMDSIPDFIAGKHDPSSITYDVPQLEPILKNTYGQILYQEQVMQIVQKLAGFTMGRADIVRKAMGKKKMDIMLQERKNFVYGDDALNIRGCVRNGINEETANAIYDKMVSFASYAFNKSHAACYAAIAMQTAYLKANYQKEYYAALLTNTMDKTEKLALYMRECKQKNIKILPPDVNTSSAEFSVNGNDIVYGLSAVKGIGTEVIKAIREERDTNGTYMDFIDFVERNPQCSKSHIENLIKCGALDYTGYNRHTLLEGMEECVDRIKKQTKVIDGQFSMFEDPDYGIGKATYDFKPFKDLTVLKKLKFEKDVTGYYISGHPLDSFEKMCGNIDITGYTDIEETPDKYLWNNVDMMVYITEVKTFYTKKDNKKMAVISVEDKTSSFEIVVFSKRYDEFGTALSKSNMLVLNCRVASRNDQLCFYAESCKFKLNG